MTNFKDLGLLPELLQATEEMGFKHPSPVQEKVIPELLSAEADLIALAQTGTGKTAAFGFPLLQKIQTESRKTQALILSPTRELCLQITQELHHYAKFQKGVNIVAVYGGASIQEQARNLKKGAQIVVATPGRMKDMMGRGLVDITKIEYCVLDEADEMLNMGFFEDISTILEQTPKDKSTWLFSATMPKEVATIARKFMHSPTEITVGERNAGASSVKHEYYLVSGRARYQALKRLADAHPNIFSVIFCRTKRDTQKVAEKLIEDGYNAGALHGDLSQNQRDLVMTAFRKKQIQLLVATDVAARGIDVDDVTHVINYQLPDEIETYTHRSGRTGRAGKSGISMVIITRSEKNRIRSIEKKIGQEFLEKQLPSGMEICEIQLYHLASRIRDVAVNADIDAYLPAIYDVLQDVDREELIRKMVSVEFGRFYNYYQKNGTLDTQHDKTTVSTDAKTVRFFINVGEKDGLDWKTLKDLLRKHLDLDKDAIYRVDVKESFSFFNSDPEIAQYILQNFEGVEMNGRRVKVEISENPENSRPGKHRKGRKKSYGGNKGNFKKNKGKKSKKSGKSGKRRGYF